jgi:hypothetical protein
LKTKKLKIGKHDRREFEINCRATFFINCLIARPGLRDTLAPLHIVNFKSGWGNMLTLTNVTAAWSAQASPLFERKTTLLTRGWFHSKAPVMC